MRCPIEKIIIENSMATDDGLEIEFENIKPTVQEIREYTTQKIEQGVLHMLEYCFNNVGNKQVNTQEELKRWIQKELLQK